ncbi:hypothetical protein PGT21_002758 [Puccinia graminis f. sp. tritici]|uniref:Uncharacterized protein n=1 Tax=Puccinia graminis f. sp. tritici TaxID=56615 RepID=A0A5B0MJ94_PUCGR|nr:hypothetical protein PGT21_002758 [Puccinia graminis f. sp. tritici]KAA1135625.1 hypothetical protein PGTUg99_027041 [Puccinia graminis f. sp. tritici]
MTNNALISVAIIFCALLQGISTRPAPAEEQPKGANPTAKMFGSTGPSGGPATAASGNAGQIIVGPVYQAFDLNSQPIILQAVLGVDGQPTIALSSSSGYNNIGASALATSPAGPPGGPAPGTLSQKSVGHTPSDEESTPKTDAAKLESLSLSSSLSHKGRSKAMAQSSAI